MKREWRTPIVQELNVSETANILGQPGNDSYFDGKPGVVAIPGHGNVIVGS